MDGMLYEVNVYTLKPTLLFKNSLPGWHGKGAYTSQQRLVLANNGENHGSFEPADQWQVDPNGLNGPDKNGILAEYDGTKFKIIERCQFTDITSKYGINALPSDTSSLWTIGWDKRSLRLKVLDNGEWKTFLLPKATYNNDSSHGWFTEWPRIREINDGKFMMDMHGMFFDFPPDFSAKNSAGIRPIGSHLRYVPDFLYWNGNLVLATDETSVQGNPLAGQPQSNLWFGSYEDLSSWGPASAYGAIWLNEFVQANQPSLPYLMNGFDNKVMHLISNENKSCKIQIQLDKDGTNQWTSYKTIDLAAASYQYVIFDSTLSAQWLRLICNSTTQLTAALHYSDNDLRQPFEGSSLFEGLANYDFTGTI